MHRKYKINCVPYCIFITDLYDYRNLHYSNTMPVPRLVLRDNENYATNIALAALASVYLERTYGN